MIKVYLMKINRLYEQEVFEEKLLQIDAARRQKVNACKNKLGRCQSLGGGLLLQYALNKSMNTEVLELSYKIGAEGKPYLSDFPSLFFNLSHSGNYVALGVCDEEVGVDIQEVKHIKFDIANRFFAREEVEKLESIEEKKQKNLTFFKIWAAKESYIKLTGKGLAQSLSSFCVNLEELTVADKEIQKNAAYLAEYLLDEFNFVLMVCSRGKQLVSVEYIEV